MEIKDIRFEESIMALLVGRVKTGKTIAASSFPNPYIMFFDGRYRVLKTYWEPKGKTDISFGVYDDWPTIIADLRKFREHFPYKTLVIDPLTFLCDKILADLREMRTGGKGGKMIGEIQVNTLEDFGGESAALSDVIDLLMTIKERYKVNIVMTAHLTFDEIRDKKTMEVVEYIPRVITGGKKIAYKLPGAFDEVYFFEQEIYAGADRYCAFTRSKAMAIAGTAMSLPVKLDFTNGNFYEILQEAIAKGPTAFGGKGEDLALDVKKRDKF